jgi:hypothetical protein
MLEEQLKVKKGEKVKVIQQVWKQCKEYPEIEVSNLGLVREKKSGNYKAQAIRYKDAYDREHDRGYWTTYVRKVQKKVHQLVWTAFQGDVPQGYNIDHINGIRYDNRLVNLRIVLAKINSSKGNRDESKGLF